LKNLFILTFAFLCFSQLGLAQKREIYIGANYLYFPTSKTPFNLNYSIFGNIPTIDTTVITYLRTTFLYSGERVVKFNVKSAYSFGYRTHWELKKKWKVSTGFDLSTFKYTYEVETTGNSTLISTDTFVNTIFSNPILPPICNFTNSVADLGTIDYNEKFSVVELKLPLEIRRIILQNRLDFYLGGFLSVPLRTNVRTESIDIEHNKDANGLEICTFVKKDLNKDVIQIKRMNYGLSVGYTFYYRKLSIGLGANTFLSNYFNNIDSNDGSNLKSNPISLNFKTGFIF
jgi:hypothetical protein